MDNHSSTPNNPYLAPKAAIRDIASPGEIILADRLTRLGAGILDGLIQFVVIMPIFVILASFTVGLDTDAYMTFIVENPIRWSILALIVVISVFLAINFRLLRDHGQTVGKRICKIRIVRSNGSPADVQRLLLYRYLPVWLFPHIPFVGNIFGLINVLLIFRESRKCLHDDIADTIVIKA